MSSEDIRKQLPEDSARFDRIDSEFKVSNVFFYFLDCMCSVVV